MARETVKKMFESTVDLDNSIVNNIVKYYIFTFAAV